VLADVTAVILAGGRGSRMGGQDKGLVQLNDKPMIAHVIDALSPQVNDIVINANRNNTAYQQFGYRVIADVREGFLGPLAGMLSGLEATNTTYALCVPCDSPLISPDLAQRLYDKLKCDEANICVAHDGERAHPVFALIERTLASSMAAFLDAGERKIDRWFAQHHTSHADFSDVASSFANINRERDLAALMDANAQERSPSTEPR
jgi:molybdopterin-guanine dinucleotide biosynthesis protein A